MDFDKEAIDEFKQIYLEEFGELISDELAIDKFSRLVSVLGVLFKYSVDMETKRGIVGHEES